jgi:hypothetical protein
MVNNDLLLGILLGFGDHNSALYQQRENMILLYQEYKPLLVKDAPVFKELKNKMEMLTDILQPVGDSTFARVGTVQFVADLNSPQTLSLLNKYQVLRGQVCSWYMKGNLLEVTLIQLIKE